MSEETREQRLPAEHEATVREIARRIVAGEMEEGGAGPRYSTLLEQREIARLVTILAEKTERLERALERLSEDSTIRGRRAWREAGVILAAEGEPDAR